MSESYYYTAAINYVRPFKQDELLKHMWQITVVGTEYINALALWFIGESIKELFYCEDKFRDAMEALLGKGFNKCTLNNGYSSSKTPQKIFDKR